MKILSITLLFILVFSFSIKSQIVTFDSVSVNPLEVCLGDQVQLKAYNTSTVILMSDDFNNDSLNAYWETNNDVMFNNPCTSAGDNWDGTTYLWVGDLTTFPRDIITIPLSVTEYCMICFDLKLATQGEPSPCEGPDEMDEGVSLQWFITGDTMWHDIIYFAPDGNQYPSNAWIGQSTAGGGMNTPFNVWNNYCFMVPQAAVSNNTQFRWHQEQVTSEIYDHWGIDNVSINCQGDTAIIWKENGTIIHYGAGVFNEYPTQNTTYRAVITNGILADSVDFNVIVNPLPDVSIDRTGFCEGAVTTVEYSGTSNIDTYLWLWGYCSYIDYPSTQNLSSYNISVNSDAHDECGNDEIRLRVTDFNGCINEFVDTFSIDICSSIDKEIIDNSLYIYPNPANNYITIESTETINKIEILDITGKNVQIYQGFQTLDTLRSIDIFTLKKGIYFIKINDSKIVKFVKQ